MIEYGLIFLLCVAIAYLWVKRDNARWETAINYSKSNRLKISESQRAIDELTHRLGMANDTIDRLRTTLMSYQSNFEEDFNEVNKRCEMIEASQRRISKNQTYMNGILSAPRSVQVSIVEQSPLRPATTDKNFETIKKQMKALEN
jgi:hypothetical protein